MFRSPRPMLEPSDAAEKLAAVAELLKVADRLLNEIAIRAPSDIASRLSAAEADLQPADVFTHAFRLADLAKAIAGEAEATLSEAS